MSPAPRTWPERDTANFPSRSQVGGGTLLTAIRHVSFCARVVELSTGTLTKRELETSKEMLPTRVPTPAEGAAT